MMVHRPRQNSVKNTNFYLLTSDTDSGIFLDSLLESDAFDLEDGIKNKTFRVDDVS